MKTSGPLCPYIQRIAHLPSVRLARGLHWLFSVNLDTWRSASFSPLTADWFGPQDRSDGHRQLPSVVMGRFCYRQNWFPVTLSLNTPEKGLTGHVRPDAHPAEAAWSRRAAPGEQGRTQEKEGQCLSSGSLNPCSGQESDPMAFYKDQDSVDPTIPPPPRVPGKLQRF